MFSLKLFGGASIQSPDGPIEGRAVQRRRLGLLALLAAPRQTGTGQPAVGVSRERIIAYLWPEAESDRGRHLLSDSVYRVNQALGGEAISTAGDELRLNPSVLPSDVSELEDAMTRGDHARVASLYAGPFLDGMFLGDSIEFERWVDSTRERFARHYATALEALAGSAEHASDHTRAVEWWRLLAAHDPYNSRIAVRFMEALDATGARAAALRHADIHASLLRAELEAEPDSAVVALVERLRGSPAAAYRAMTSERPPLLASEPSSQRSLVHIPAIKFDTRTRPIGPASRPRWPAGLAFAAAAVALLFVVVSAGAKHLVLPSARSTAPSIAVLPFTDVSEDHDNEYFGDGMTEELINTFAKVPEVRVASRTSAFVYKGRAVDVRDVGRQLGVATVLEGSVRKSGSKLRITARLVSAGDGYQLWSDVYERTVTGGFAVQKELAAAIVGELRHRLLHESDVGGGPRTTRRMYADDVYLRSRFAWRQP